MAKPTISPDTEIVEQRRLVPLYRVVLLDDNDHTYDYVIEMLQKIFIFSLEQAYHHAEEVDRVDHLRIAGSRIRAGPDPFIWPGCAPAALARFHVGRSRTGWLSRGVPTFVRTRCSPGVGTSADAARMSACATSA